MSSPADPRPASTSRTRSPRGPRILGALGLLLCASCERVTYTSSGGEAGSGGSPSLEAASVSRADVLRTAAHCATSLHTRAAEALEALASATEEARLSPDAAHREAARAAWVEASLSWQQTFHVRVGPGGPATLPEGSNLREQVDPWPSVSRCLVEKALVEEAYAAKDFGTTSLPSVRGLPAAEYLLFYEGRDNACPESTTLNTSGSWSALAPEELDARKAAYAAVVTKLAAEQARAIAEAWSPEVGDFATRFASPGTKGAPFADETTALNALATGLFELDTGVKDDKVGVALGRVDCEAAPCPVVPEATFAHLGVEQVRQNLFGFRRVFEGCDDRPAFSGLLASLGATSLALSLPRDLDVALELCDELHSGDLSEAAAVQTQTLESLHARLQQISDALKTEVTTLLDVEPPSRIEGDND